MKLKLALKEMRSHKIITIQKKITGCTHQIQHRGLSIASSNGGITGLAASSCKRPTSKGTAWNRC
jgi:hypothetical protein